MKGKTKDFKRLIKPFSIKYIQKIIIHSFLRFDELLIPKKGLDNL